MANEVDNVMAATTEKVTMIVGAFPQIIVTGTEEKPFYQIMYLENEDGEIHLGFGSYDLAYVFQWLKEFFGVTHASAVNPESLRPKGRWVVNRKSFDGYTHHRCSHCGTDAPFVYTYIDEWDEDLDGEWCYVGQRENGIEEQMGSFCPYCGSDMRGESDAD